MTDVISHRGPDGFGFYHDEHAKLGHRRLSIIDLAGGSQPMYNEDRSLVVVYNGEIYNHSDLRQPLEQAGHRYHSRCDTETLLHAYEEYGPASLEHYRGMFAFVIWDGRNRTLFGARDRLGIKPFYYFWDGRLFAFASEIKALLEHPEIAARLDGDSLAEYLAFGYTSGEGTMFAGIRQLLPGHWLRLTLDGRGGARLEIQSYWDAPKEPSDLTDSNDESWVADCRRRLEETVRMRLMSDVPLGMFLSGGVDSSAIAALMKRMVEGPVVTFSVGYQETAFSELTYAREVAGHLGTKHQEVMVGPRDFFNALPRLVWHEDEPVTWPSSVSLYFVSALAAREVKVVLTGEGSDELFGGYGRYGHYLRSLQWMQYYGVVPFAAREAVRKAIAGSSLLSADWRRKLGHTVFGRRDGLPSLYLDNFYCAFDEPGLKSLGASGNPYASYLRHWDAAAGASSTLRRLLYCDQKTYLAELLRKQDRMSMACSIESRVPFLDHRFVEFAGRVPDRLKIRGGIAKFILKKAASDLLPDSIVHRRKMGFPTPISAWLFGDAGRAVFDLLRERGGLINETLDMGAVESLLDRHQRRIEDATDRIWRLLNLQLWGDMYLTGRRQERWEGFVAAPSR